MYERDLRIFCLDTAPTAVGWAFAEGRSPPTCGTYHPPRCGERFVIAGHEFRAWLHGRITSLEPHVVVIEKPIHVPTNDLKTLRLQYGFPMLATLACSDRAVKYDEYPLDEVRQSFLGRTYRKIYRNRPALKAAVIAECRARGWQPDDDNAADALAVLDLARVKHLTGWISRVQARLGLSEVAA